MKTRAQDTIAAIATPVGDGALAIVRVSGPQALAIADTVFRGSRRPSEVPGFTVLYGDILDGAAERVDEALAVVFRMPHSYTGEDAVELSCHGGVFVTTRVLAAVLAAGARQADPGEFTKRAFLNGRIDLSQAEAVADLITARSLQAQRASLDQLEGKLAGKVRALREELVSLCSLLEIELDFSEEGINVITNEEIANTIGRVNGVLAEMEQSFELGRMYRDGVSVVLMGKPNVGKSSLFNALLREKRAIVTHMPGTTRDSLEENISLGGMLFRITDTAGLREAVDVMEAEGVSRSRAVLQRADIAVVVVDASAATWELDIEAGLGGLSKGQKGIVAVNKIDLVPGVRTLVNNRSVQCAQVAVSAKTGEGLEDLRKVLSSLVLSGSVVQERGVQITCRRHLDAVGRARRSLIMALESVHRNATNEFVAFDVREAMEALAEITGEVTSEEILNSIFSRFCVGK